MTLEDTFRKAIERIKSGQLTLEAHYRQFVITPILRGLGWDSEEPMEWKSEHAVGTGVGTGYVDDALFDGKGQPLVFLEAKRRGNLNPDAENKLFEYARDEGVPILVLTDGDTWDLYLPWAPGKPPDRRFVRMVLTESRDLAADAADLESFLAKDAIWSGEAEPRARNRLKQVHEFKLGRGGLDDAWNELLSEANEALRDALIQRVVQNVHARPSTRDVNDFLRQQATALASGGPTPAPALATPSPPAQPSPQEIGKKRPLKKIVGFRLLEEFYGCKDGKRALLMLAAALQRYKSTFLDDLLEHYAGRHPKNPRLVRPDHDVLERHPEWDYRPVDDNPGYLLDVWDGTPDKIKRMRFMVERAGLNPEKDFEAQVVPVGKSADDQNVS